MILKKVDSVSPPRLIDASSIEESIFFKFETLDKMPRVKLQITILITMIQGVP
jgi:hypothetical protein